mgnify:CR=1 FL=1
MRHISRRDFLKTGALAAGLTIVPNSVLGNILCAEIKIEEGCSLSELDIRHWLADKLQEFKIPRKIKFVENIALTRTGKLKRT